MTAAVIGRIACVAALLLAVGGADGRAALPSAPTVTVVTAKRGTLDDRMALTGTFVARDEALVTPQIDGLAVTAILAEEGDTVASGQVLARLSRDALEASLAENAASAARAVASVSQAQGQIAEAEANRVEASAALVRASALLARNDLSREAFDQRQASADVANARLQAAHDALAVARADVALAAAQRQELEVRLTRTDLRAPVAGLVSERRARLGAVVGTGSEPLFRIVANGTVEMEAAVPETSLVRLRAGQAAALTSVGGSFAGRVRLVSPEVDPTSRLGRVRIAIEATGTRPAIGSFVRASVSVAERTGVVVPLSAVLFGPDGAMVDVVTADPAGGHQVAARHVAVALADADEAVIGDGLSAGEPVVAVSGTFLRDGDRVVPVSATEAAR